MKILIKADRMVEGSIAATVKYRDIPLIEWVLKSVRQLNSEKISILTAFGQKDFIRSSFVSEPVVDIDFITEISEIPHYDIILDGAAIYNTKKLKKACLKNTLVDKAIIWKLDSSKDLESINDEFCKESLYPISKYYLRPLGIKLAEALSKTSITANQVTAVTFVFSIMMATFIAIPTRLFAVLGGMFCLLCELLDHTDGRLARIKKEQSSFGAYIDMVLGLVGWNLAFIAIALRLYFVSNNPAYLIMGLFYLLGDYIFNYTIIKKQSMDVQGTNSWEKIKISQASLSKIHGFKKIISFLDDMDIRLHLFVICAFLDKFIYVFLYHLIYINFRWVLNVTNEWLKKRKV